VKHLALLAATVLLLPTLSAFGEEVLPSAAETSAAETTAEAPAASATEPAAPADSATSEPSTAPATAAPESGLSTEGAKQQIQEIAEKVDKNEQAQEVSAGILKQIYLLAERMESPMFHWAAFALMVTGVVSFALQLVLGKLLVLSRLSLSLTEILSDAMGLAVSLVGLVLTTQAAAQNSTFTTSPAAVLSATGAGVLLGFFFFKWGTSQELSAADGRKAQAKTPAAK
jgi:hypothetical protein